jgi:Protein of unknown function (DUF3040)
MDSGLSWHEHQLLGLIEEDLRSDRTLDRALRTMRAPRRRPAVLPWAVRLGRQIPAATVALMVGFALVLTVLVAQIDAVSSFAFLGVVWTATALAFGAKAVSRHRSGGRG